MTLHFVTAHTTATSAAGTEDTFAASGFTPTGESEVQARSTLGGNPRLVGISGVTGDVALAATATGGPYFKVGLNTWVAAQYFKMPWFVWGNANAGGSPVISYRDQGNGGIAAWFDQGIALDEDADWDIKTMVTSANTTATVALYESYGAQIPWNGYPTTWRLVSAASDTTANTWSTVGSITDLDPRLSYRVNALLGVAEDQPLLGVRLTSPGNSTYVGTLCNQIQASGVQPVPVGTFFVPDSIIVSGVETVTVTALTDSASKPSAYVGFQPIGASSARSAPGGVGKASPNLVGGTLGGVTKQGGFGGLFGIGR